VLTPVSDVEKVPQLMLVVVQGSGYKQARVLDAAVHHSIWRPAAHDGTPFPRGVAVLLLPASLEDQVPENHLLRMIDRHVNLEFIRAKLKDAYSDAGRPSIDPELLLRMLLVGYLYGVTSERKLVKSYACIWRGVGSPDWASIRRFRTTLRFPRTGMDDSRNRICFRRSLRRSSPAA
jgi:hypothetical protein